MSSPRRVPFFDYPAVFTSMEDEFMKVLHGALMRGAFILQEDLAQFERNLADYLGAAHVIGVADGTNALRLAMLACGIGPGDEVLVPSHTYVASVSSIRDVGAMPVLVDCGDDHLIDPDSVRAALTPRSRAIMPVQLNGRTADMDAISAIAAEAGLVVVEDAAQALGSRFGERYAGTFGAAGTFSFYPAKLLGCFGDGGAVVTDDDEVATRVRLLRDHGRNEVGEVVAWGTNCRLDNIQAAVLDVKLSRFDDEVARRREIALRYHHGLSGFVGLVLPPAPGQDLAHFDVYQNYEIEAEDRDALQAHLAANGVGTIVQFGGKAIHQHPLGLSGTSLPRTELVYERALMLPMHTALSDADIDHVIASIESFFAGGG